MNLLWLSISGLLGYQFLFGSPVLGLQLSVVLFGAAFYVFLPTLLPDRFEPWRRDPGLRALLSAYAGFVMVVFGIGIGTFPTSAAFGLLSSEISKSLEPFLAVFLLVIALTSLYISLVRDESTIGDDSEVYELGIKLAAEPEKDDLDDRLEALPLHARLLVVFVFNITIGVVLVPLALVTGMLGAGLNALYPIPELLLLALLVLTVTGPAAGANWRPGWIDISQRAIDGATDASRNLAGIILTIFCMIGLMLTGMVFSLGLFGIMPTVAETLSVDIFLSLLDLPAREAGRVIVVVWLVLGLPALLLAYGVFGFVFWFQQLRRLPQYVLYWEDYWKDGLVSAPTVSKTKPVGLVLPLILLMAPFAILGIFNVPESENVVSVGTILFDVVWPVVVILAGWSIVKGIRREPNSVRREGRAVIFGLLVQLYGSFLFLAPFANVAYDLTLWILIGLIVSWAYFLPEVNFLTERIQSSYRHLGHVYLFSALGMVLVLWEYIGAAPVWMWGFAAVAWALAFYLTHLDLRMDLRFG